MARHSELLSILHHTIGCGGTLIMAPLMIYGEGCQYSVVANSGDAYMASCAALCVSCKGVRKDDEARRYGAGSYNTLLYRD